MNDISSLIKEMQWEKLPHRFHHVRLQLESVIYETEGGLSLDPESASAVFLALQTFRTVRDKLLLLISHPVYVFLL